MGNKTKIQRLLQGLAHNITINLDNFEPVDSQGYSMIGTVKFQGGDYFVHLSLTEDDGYEGQAALDILAQFDDQATDPVLLNAVQQNGIANLNIPAKKYTRKLCSAAIEHIANNMSVYENSKAGLKVKYNREMYEITPSKDEQSLAATVLKQVDVFAYNMYKGNILSYEDQKLLWKEFSLNAATPLPGQGVESFDVIRHKSIGDIRQENLKWAYSVISQGRQDEIPLATLFEEELEGKQYYRFKVSLCEGQEIGEYGIIAESFDIAESEVLDAICSKLVGALPEYNIPVSVTLIEE